MNRIKIPFIELAGSPYQMGRKHGIRAHSEIGEIIEKRLELLAVAPGLEGEIGQAEALDVGRRSWEAHEVYDRGLMRELTGIADGAEVDPIELLLMNGYPDFREILAGPLAEGCTAFWVARDMTQDALTYTGQTWDMAADACSYVTVLRLYPDNGPAALLLTLSGCVGVAGINEAGITVVINHLSSTDVQEGVTSSFVVRKALRQVNLESAVRVLLEATRCSGHNYLVADATGRAVNVETTATQASVTLLQKSYYVHANHYLSAKLQALERQQPEEKRLSSITRWARLRQLLSSRSGQLSPKLLQELLASHEDSDYSICRHARTPEETATCAAAIMSPQEGKMWATSGNPCRQEFELFQL